MAEGLIGSEILRIATDIRAIEVTGTKICNLTVGDFRPSEFRIPESLEREIIKALREGETNYPPSDGVLALRKSVVELYERWLGLKYPVESVLVTGGSRPGIYATYRALVNPSDVVVYPVPSWNNNHYCHLLGATGVPVVCDRKSAFLPTRKALEDVIRGATLLALNSPLNPTGTAFTRDVLEEICDLVLEENLRRSPHVRPLFIMYDHVYWMLTFDSLEHVHPVGLRPELAKYTIFIDGISKPFAATGVRVGWVVGPSDIVERMMSIIGHVGAWAPRAEQIATSKLLGARDEIEAYHNNMKKEVNARLTALYDGLMSLQRDGFTVDAIAPMGAIYLSARFLLAGKRTPDGSLLKTNDDIRTYLLRSAHLGIVPFEAFGTTDNAGWFRMSVGAVSLAEINQMFPRLRKSLASLTN
jgi:aspartate aminotransferase